ncbi:MAG: M56 family metallopeptidase [Lachnospiraceae bacterium]|nr:M56 family metallopeptidase [Lachnospiraceae bacterium]
MDWASNLFVILLMTDIAGTIFFLIGRLLSRLAKYDVVFLRFLTKATLFAYLVPFVYMTLYLGKRFGMIGIESDINLFYVTSLTLEVNIVLGCVWTGLFLVLLISKLQERYDLAVQCRGNIPEEDENILRVFEDVCADLGISGKVSLCRNDLMGVACFTYHHGPVVILPFEQYTEKEAEIIFYHELCHYLNKDLYLKTIGCIAALLHVFNPAVHILMDEMGMLCERYCDRAACKKGENRFTEQEYFQVLLNLRVDSGRRDRYQLLAFADSRSDCERRTEYMDKYHTKGGLKKGMAVTLAACFLLGSSITSLAAGDGVTEVYDELAKYTSVKEPMGAEEEGAFTEDISDEEAVQLLAQELGIDPDKIVMTDDNLDIAPYSDLDMIHIIWTIPADTVYMSTGYRAEIGERDHLYVFGTPTDVEYEIGIKDPKAHMWYAEGSGVVEGVFYVTIKGRHYFYVYNRSEDTVLHVDAFIDRKSRAEVEAEGGDDGEGDEDGEGAGDEGEGGE